MKPSQQPQSLLDWRRANGYSQYKAAEILGLPRSTYRTYEDGRCAKGQMLKLLAEKTGVSIEVLAGVA